MPRRRRLSEATVREDAAIAAAAGVILSVLVGRYPAIPGLAMAAHMLDKAHDDLVAQADALVVKPGEEPRE